jgi:colanic acid biosynthesis protein WcaH
MTASDSRWQVSPQLSHEDFEFLVMNSPLAAVDICVSVDQTLLLGKRNREPLRGRWFTPGGCVRKGERWQDTAARVALSELGLHINPAELVSMGSWDQFYDHSVCGEEVFTHYVNRAHALFLSDYPDIISDEQHSEFRWVTLQEIGNGTEFSVYLKQYVNWFENLKESEGC